MSFQSIITTIWADVEAIFSSPVGKTLDNIAAEAAGVGTVVGVCELNPTKKIQIATDFLGVEGALSTVLTGTAAPTADTIANIFNNFKSTDPAIFQTIAVAVSNQLFNVLKTYDGTVWKDVLTAYLTGIRVGSTVEGGTAPVATPAN